MLGRNRSFKDKEKFCRYWYLRSKAKENIKILTSGGEFSIERDITNKGRGDTGSINRRYASIKERGWQNESGGPFLFEHATDKDKYSSGHCATVTQGIKKLWQEQPDHENLKELIEDGIPMCDVYIAKIPDFWKAFVCEMGNAEQENTTLATPQELWEGTVEACTCCVGCGLDKQPPTTAFVCACVCTTAILTPYAVRTP